MLISKQTGMKLMEVDVKVIWFNIPKAVLMLIIQQIFTLLICLSMQTGFGSSYISSHRNLQIVMNLVENGAST